MEESQYQKRVKLNDIPDPKFIGVPNICFSLTEPDDKREEQFIEQRKTRGFDDSETWSLRDSIGQFILPRLKRYREIIDGFIVNEDNFYEKIDKAIRAFELLVRDNGALILNEEETKEFNEGLAAYNEIFMGLWW